MEKGVFPVTEAMSHHWKGVLRSLRHSSYLMHRGEQMSLTICRWFHSIQTTIDKETVINENIEKHIYACTKAHLTYVKYCTQKSYPKLKMCEIFTAGDKVGSVFSNFLAFFLHMQGSLFGYWSTGCDRNWPMACCLSPMSWAESDCPHPAFVSKD